MKTNTMFFLFLLPAYLWAQTYTSADLPAPGDTVRISEAMTAGTVVYQTPGMGQSWDFSGLVPFNQRLDTFAAVSSLSMMYQAVFNNLILYPSNHSNLASRVPAQQGPGGPTGGDGMLFFKKTTADFRQTGQGINLNGTDIPIPFDNPDIIYTFPLTVTSPSDSCISGYEITIPGMGYMKQIKNRKNTIDASGTLITPFGTFTDVLRIRSDIEQWDSISMEGGMPFPAMTSYITEYKWIKAGYAVPLLMISESQFGVSVEYIDIWRGINWFSIDAIAETENKLRVFPNPSAGGFTVEVPSSISGEYSAELFNMNGRRVMLETGNKRQLQLSLDLPAGVYTLRIQSGNTTCHDKLIIH